MLVLPSTAHYRHLCSYSVVHGLLEVPRSRQERNIALSRGRLPSRSLLSLPSYCALMASRSRMAFNESHRVTMPAITPIASRQEHAHESESTKAHKSDTSTALKWHGQNKQVQGEKTRDKQRERERERERERKKEREREIERERYIYIYIYIYREREIERARASN